jgi:hypothetical protein
VVDVEARFAAPLLGAGNIWVTRGGMIISGSKSG